MSEVDIVVVVEVVLSSKTDRCKTRWTEGYLKCNVKCVRRLLRSKKTRINYSSTKE